VSAHVPRPGGGSGGNADGAELAKFDALAARFWDRHGDFRPLHLLNPVRLQFIAERAPLAGHRVLDVGCGGGLLTESLARAGAEVTGIDLAPGMIEVARLHATEGEFAINYRVAGAEELAQEHPGRFEVVTCMETLEHVPDPRLIPPGTHEYERLILPSELARWARAAGLTLAELAGIEFNPLTGRVALSNDVSVNYLAHLTL